MAATDLPGDLGGDAFEAAVERLAELTRISSSSTDPAGLAAFAEHLAAELTRRGLAARVTPADSPDGPLPVLVATTTPDERGALLLLGHIDTVLPATAPRRDGERLVATGAIDMKGGLATLLAALDLLDARRLRPPPGLRLVLAPDEEVGGEISRRLTATEGGTARAVWVLEPGEPAPGDGETIVLGRRGLESFRLEVRGRAAHSGLQFAEGRSALVAAAEWAAAAAALSRAGDGPTVNPARLVAGDSAFVDELAAHADLLGRGVRLNVVPDRAVVEGEFRFLRSEDRRTVSAALAAAADAVATQREVEARLAFAGEIPPVPATAARRAVAGRAVELAATRGWRLVVETDRGGVSFPNFLPAATHAPVLDGLGPVGGGMHTREEFVDLRSFARRIVLLADLLTAEGASAS
ncbi:MAG: M20/M25/M40 family metallo-hydrolase [Thermoanaerobaculia bacterium]|nr:M20/M25/M40 family metallo-hydrolase [Thermoanaerobaculia bacterium]